jgi:hypothetical protein
MTGLAREVAGDHAGAAQATREFVRFSRRTGLQSFLPLAVATAARLASAAGRHEDALRLFGTADAIEERTGSRHSRLADRLDPPMRRGSAAALGAPATQLVREGRHLTTSEAARAADEVLGSVTAPDHPPCTPAGR